MRNEIIKKYGIAILITIGIAIIGISSTYAYFATSMTSETDGGPDFVASATTSSSNITLNTIRSINATDRKPGYNDVMAFSVISASNTTFDVNMVANSTIETPISYTVYKTTSQVNVSNSCENVSDTINSQYSENCSITNIGSLGDSIASGTITNNTLNYVLLSNQEASSTIVYYYVVFTYPNANASQDSDFFKSLNVSIEIEEKDTSLENSYVNYSLTYTGLPASYSSAHNIVNQSVKKGTSVTVTDADVEGYRLNEIIITGNDTTTIPVEEGYNLSNIDIVLDVNTEIEMRYVTGNSTASTNTSVTPKVSSKGTSGGTTIVTPVSTSSTTVYNTLPQTLNTNNVTLDDRYDFEMNTTSDGPVTLTFDVSSKASEGDTVTLMHYKESTHKWENLGSQTVDDALTATWVLTSFSPFSIVVTHKTNNIPTSGGKTLVQKILEDNNATVEANVPERTAASFDAVYTDSNTTFFKTNNAEHGDTVYYYAGNATNNWVIFGTCKDSTYNCTVGDDLYWRIIRTNEAATGGGVRLLYSGSGSATTNGHKSIAKKSNGYIKATAFNATTSSSKGYKTHMDRYVGYMYGTSGYTLANIRENTESSTIKGVIDSWYTTTFTEDKLKERISTTAVYCNDRSYTSATWYSSVSSYNYFGANGRLNDAKAPSYACGANSSGYGNYFTGGNDKADKFSSEETAYGNGLLSNPVALMTADEVAFAGGRVSTVLTSPYAWYYLNAGTGSATGRSCWWALSPRYADPVYARLFYLNGSDNPSYLSNLSAANASHVARPVLSLDSETLWLQGDGSVNDPYRIIEN